MLAHTMPALAILCRNYLSVLRDSTFTIRGPSMFENCFFIAMPKYDSFGHPQAPKPGLAQNLVPQLDIFKDGAEY
jgi:hypothetical protein